MDQLEGGRAEELWAGEGMRDLVRSPPFCLTEFTYEMYGKGKQVGATNGPSMLRTSGCSQDAKMSLLKPGKSQEHWVQLVNTNAGSMVAKS